MKRHLFASLLVGALVYTTPTLLHAASAKPKFLMTPTTATHFSITNRDTATVQYTVLNQTKIARTLTMKPITGISQVTTGTNVCANPFTLQPNASCLLTLAVGASEFGFDISGGPEVCKTQSAGNNSPDPFLCSQPAKVNQLAISRRTSPVPLQLTVNPSFLTLVVNGIGHHMIVTNHSFVSAATNVRANFEGTDLNGNVTQDASDCTSIAPQQSCTIIFTPGSTPITETSFSIQGSNTSVIGASIQITAPSTAVITVSPDALAFSVDGGSGSVTVTNTSRSVTATSIAAVLTGALADAGVTQDSSNCASVLPGATCTLTFTAPSPTSVSNTAVPIYGTNTTHTSVNIAVNGTSQIPITLNPSSLTFAANGQDLQTMTIQNTSPTFTALAIVPDMGDLAGVVTLVSNNCQSVPHGGTCTLAFLANITQTDGPIVFNIQGDNTIAVQGTITVNPVNYAYVGNFQSQNISRCDLSINTGALSSCGIVSSLQMLPIGMVLHTDNTYAYTVGIGDGNTGLNICAIQPGTGALNCGEILTAVAGNPNAQGIAINPDNTILYIGENLNPGGDPSTNNIIYKCPISTSGDSVDACTTAGATGLPPEGMQQITINPDGSFVYFITPTSGAYSCPVDGPTGNLSSCSDTGADNLPTQSNSIAISSDNSHAYIAGSGGVTGCEVDPSTGALSNCQLNSVSPDIIGSGDDIKLNSTNTKAYIATFVNTSNTPYTAICNVSGVNVSGCEVSPTSAPDGAVRSVAIALLQ